MLLLVSVLLILSAKTFATDLRASLANLPIHSQLNPLGKPHGGFVDIVRAIDEVYNEGHISINIYPFARSLNNVVKGKADFHLPLIRLPHIAESSLPYAYVSEPVTQVSFVLYSYSQRAVLNMETPGLYRIATMQGHSHFFPFDVTPLSDIETGIKLVAAQRIDGFIMEQDAVDAYIRQARVSNIRRTLFVTLDSCIVIAKGARGQAVDKIISRALKTLKSTGQLAEINATIHQPYNPWQPADMHW